MRRCLEQEFNSLKQFKSSKPPPHPLPRCGGGKHALSRVEGRWHHETGAIQFTPA
jgi:hypothetical protein